MDLALDPLPLGLIGSRVCAIFKHGDGFLGYNRLGWNEHLPRCFFSLANWFSGMRLTAKIVGCVLFLLLLLLAVDGYFSVKREIALFETDMRRDAVHVGHAMRDAVSKIFPDGEQDAVVEFIERRNLPADSLELRWVSIRDTNDATVRPLLPVDELEDLLEGREVSMRFEPEDGPTLLVTYVPVSLQGSPPGAIEIREPLSELNDYIRESILRRAALIVILILLSAILLVALGLTLIGRPLQQLVARTREIGKGNFSKPLMLLRHDEFSVLAVAINEMSGDLSSARRAVESATRAKIQALENLRHNERLATVGRLASGIAHELGTPLNVISGRAKLVFDEELPREEIEENARIIADQTERMTRIIQQLLDFARRRTPQRTSIAIAPAIRQILELLHPLFSRHRITPSISCTHEGVTAFVDPTQLQQISTNLIMNAIDAMQEGGTLEISISKECCAPPTDPESTREYLCLSFRDEGEGIRAEDMEQVFEPFFTRKIGKGTGLGLSITKEIVEEHGGWILVSSVFGMGATFSVYLPTEEIS